MGGSGLVSGQPLQRAQQPGIGDALGQQYGDQEQETAADPGQRRPCTLRREGPRGDDQGPGEQELLGQVQPREAPKLVQVLRQGRGAPQGADQGPFHQKAEQDQSGHIRQLQADEGQAQEPGQTDFRGVAAGPKEADEGSQHRHQDPYPEQVPSAPVSGGRDGGLDEPRPGGRAVQQGLAQNGLLGGGERADPFPINPLCSG